MGIWVSEEVVMGLEWIVGMGIEGFGDLNTWFYGGLILLQVCGSR
jgi:hypothetical protein